MRAEKAHFPIVFMCRMLLVSRAGYYAWRSRGESARRLAKRKLATNVQVIFDQSRGCYGSPRVHEQTRKLGLTAGHNQVARAMRKMGIQARALRRFVRTTDSGHEHPTSPNLLQRDFTATAPNQKWASDITYIPTAQGWLYLAVVVDLFSRRIVGWSMSSRIDLKLAMAALTMALEERRPRTGLIHHSDRGSQYAAHEYREALSAAGALSSMSRRGDCWDNAVVESFFSTLKTELVHRKIYLRHADARAEIFEYLEIFYNRRRIHSTLDYCTPQEYEDKAA